MLSITAELLDRDTILGILPFRLKGRRRGNPAAQLLLVGMMARKAHSVRTVEIYLLQSIAVWPQGFSPDLL